MNLLLLLSLNSFASPHIDAMQKLSLPHVVETTIQVGDDTFVNVKYHGLNKPEADNAIKIITVSSKLALSYLNNNGFDASDCKNPGLDVYDINDKDLNNRTLMSFVNWEKRSSRGIYAFYDSLLAPKGRASIFMTSSDRVDAAGLSESKRKIILSHEIMHYWQDRTCNLDGDIENQASQFGTHAASHL